MSWKVTVRHRSSVKREKFATLDEALAEARRRVEDVRRDGRLQTVNFLREFPPDKQVHARIEISGPGLIRGPEGGIDLMGDGTAIAYTGAIRKQAIESNSIDQALERLREALSA